MKLPLHQGPYYRSDIHDANGETVAQGSPHFTIVGDERAAEIVRAVNVHDDLVAALKALRIDANRLADRNHGGTYEEDVRRSIAVADVVLAKAQR